MSSNDEFAASGGGRGGRGGSDDLEAETETETEESENDWREASLWKEAHNRSKSEVAVWKDSIATLNFAVHCVGVLEVLIGASSTSDFPSSASSSSFTTAASAIIGASSAT
mmetsp:Transcript_23564/g.41949  ORF Transcript_23564/g.41949 Transcript_23564/m.41949 type:complete len:111 (-) Transcript_23564:377-709(-)